MEIVIDTSGFTDDYTEDLYFAFYALKNDEVGLLRYSDVDNFKIERILLEEEIDDWEHYRAIRLYDFCDEDVFYKCCSLCNSLELGYEEN